MNISQQEAHIILEFLNRVTVCGIVEATNLAAVAQKLNAVASVFPDNAINDANVENTENEA